MYKDKTSKHSQSQQFNQITKYTYLLFSHFQFAQQAEGFFHFAINAANDDKYLALEEIFCLLILLVVIM